MPVPIMKTIPLTQNLSALVDDDDYYRLITVRWYAMNKNGTFYAARKVNGRTIYMHHIVSGQPAIGLVCDHINRNGLDNRRANLRHVTRQINALNTGASGVTWDTRRGLWKAQIMVAGRQVYLGCYADKQIAVAVRQAAKQHVIDQVIHG